MPGPDPGAGYAPTFSMPIIGPAPEGTDPATHYGSPASVGLSVSIVDPHRLRIEVYNSYRELLAMNGGLLRFRPAGERILDGHAETAPGGGAIVIETWAVDATTIKDRLPGGMSPPREVIYLDVDEASVRTALDVDALWDFVPQSWLEHVWQIENGSAPPAGTTLAQLKTHYLNTAMLGNARFFVPGGTVIGQANAVTGSSCAFTLRFTNAGGDALSPVPYIRLMPSQTVPGLSSSFTYGGFRWEHHPLIAATNGMPIPVDIYVKFEIYDTTTHSYVPIPAGTTVELMDYDELDSDVLATHTADAEGVAHFGFARQQDLNSLDSDEFGTTPDIYFRVRSGGISTPFAHHDSLPAEWSTNGWKSIDDQDGYYADFRGTQIGAASAPMVFRIGLDFHIKLLYRSNTHQPAQWKAAPPGLQVRIIHFSPLTGGGGENFYTDEAGEVHDVFFNIQAGNDVHFIITFRTRDDPGINASDMRVVVNEDGDMLIWDTSHDDADRNNPGPTFYPGNDKTTIGEHGSPLHFQITVEERRVALNFLKQAREWSTTIYRLTSGTWPAIEGGISIANYTPAEEILEFLNNGLSWLERNIGEDLPSTDPRSFSFPEGRVNITADSHWQRDTIMHELSHQLMWRQADYSVLGDLWDYHMIHRFELVTNPLTAWIEGWAQFIEKIITGNRPLVNNVFESGAWVSITSRPNLGNSVEGAYASALLAIFDTYIAPATASGPVNFVHETENGDVMGVPDNSWLSASGLSGRFRNLIWGPLRGMRGRSDLSPRTFALQVARLNTTGGERNWHQVINEFSRFNILVDPAISSVSVNTGPAAGGTVVDINGENFSVGTNVYFDAVIVPPAQTTVHDSTRITIVSPPGSAGAIVVRVVCSGGELTFDFTYT